MKIICMIAFLLAGVGSVFASPPEGAKRTELGVFIGSLKVPYSSVVTGIDFQSAPISDFPLGIDARLQSRNTFLILNPSAFDLDVAALYYPTEAQSDLGLGLGYSLMYRNFHDVRSQSSTAYAPFVRAKYNFAIYHGDIDLDLKVSFDISLFADGIRFKLRPQFIFGLGDFYASIEANAEAMARLWGSGRIPQDATIFMDTFLTLGVRFEP